MCTAKSTVTFDELLAVRVVGRHVYRQGRAWLPAGSTERFCVARRSAE
jgi:hypothetical protein